MFDEMSLLRLAQADGGLPAVVAAGSAPGESVSRHTSKFKGLPQGWLDGQVLGRIGDYVNERH